MATAFVGSLKLSGKIPRHFGDYDPLGQVGSESSEEGVQEEEDEDNWRLAREADGAVGIRASSAWGNSFSRYPVTPSGTADCSIDLSADMDVGDNKVELLTLQKHHMSPELTDGTARLQAPDSDTELQTPLRVQPIVAKPLETWRMVAFVLSLILCILCTMSFAFLIPCPGHPSRRAHWNISFPDASSTIALVSVRLQKDSTPGIVVLYRASNNSSGNDSCAFSGVPAPCSVLVALSLADGLVLWKHSEPGIAHALVCSGGVQTSQNSSTICVMTKGDGTLIAFDPIDGHMIWVIRSTPDDHLIDLVWPLLFLPDLNSDGIVEVLLACAQASPRKNTSLFYLISGSTGKPIGQPVPHDLPIGKEEPTPVIHLHDGKDAYVIYSTGPELLALSVSEMYKLALIQSEILSAIRTSIVSKKLHKPLGLSPHTLFRSRHGPFIQLTLIPGNGGDENSSLLLMTSWQMTLLIGPALNHSLWSISLGPVYSCPAFGRFSNDSFSDIMVQTLNGSGFSKVSLLDGENGQEVWTARTCGGEVPPPSVLPFGNDLFAFVFWSLGNPLESQSTNCNRTGSPYSLWMLRADLPHTLFALANSSSRPIISNVLSEWGNEPTLVSISRAGRHLSSGLLLQAWLLQFDLPKKVALTVPSDLQSLE